MRGLIDPARKAGDDEKARVGEIARDLACEFETRGGRIARADDRDVRLSIAPRTPSKGGASSSVASRGG